jgi:phospholipase C
VAADRLPQVAWIVPAEHLSEHPAATPSAGAFLTARLIEALASNPKVWAKTVLILNYDENDGFFDHMPPPVPPAGTAQGASTVKSDGEVFHGEPVGLGPRVPMIVVSPWTKGGYVNSELFDHTSVLRFLEARFGVAEPHISPWRRAVCGDLTSVFDFKTPNAKADPLPDASALPARAQKAKALPFPRPPAEPEKLPRQEAGQRPARALPYAVEVAGELKPEGLVLSFANTGRAGAAFNLYPAGGGEPRFYAVAGGKTLQDVVPIDGVYDLSLYGPNGFLRGFHGEAASARAEATARFDAGKGQLIVTLRNTGVRPLAMEVTPAAYADAPPRQHFIDPGGTTTDAWDLRASHNWYDLVVTCVQAPSFRRRFAGHGEDGKPSVSDPLFGRQS